MIIVGCDYHPAFQQIALIDSETGDCVERRLQHREEAEKFCRDVAAQGMKVRVGVLRSYALKLTNKNLGRPKASVERVSRVETTMSVTCGQPAH
jgi:hypothetical protein